MKSHKHGRAGGFTLIELLVVITIIAVLAGAGFAAANAGLQRAKKVVATNAITGIESAVNNFYTEYSTMPKTLAADTEVDTKTDKALLNTLFGYTDAEGLNTRGIKFLTMREGKRIGSGGKDGVITSGAGPNVSVDGIYDPWGGTYKIMLDGDYDETIVVRPKGSNNNTTLNGRRVAAWSDGADGKDGIGKPADDVVSWNK